MSTIFDEITAGITMPVDSPLPGVIVWMPVGTHTITAGLSGGGVFNGKIICDEEAYRSIAASFQKITAEDRRVMIDFNHEEGEASAWVEAFGWDPSRGILAYVKWSDAGKKALLGKSFYSFSPSFLGNKITGRVEGLITGKSAGGLVNQPAFTAMPALIAARHSVETEENLAELNELYFDVAAMPGEAARELLLQIASVLAAHAHQN